MQIIITYFYNVINFDYFLSSIPVIFFTLFSEVEKFLVTVIYLWFSVFILFSIFRYLYMNIHLQLEDDNDGLFLNTQVRNSWAKFFFRILPCIVPYF